MTCPYFGSCGGCTSQHVPYEVQVENKRARVASLLQKIGFSGQVKVFSSLPFGYRNRMDFIFHPAGLGLRKAGSWERIVDITECPIANARVNILLEEVRAWFWHREALDIFDIKKQKGTLKYCLIRACENTDDCALSFVMNEESSRLLEHVEMVKAFAEGSSAKSVLVTYVPRKSDVSVGEECFSVKGNVFLEERVLGLPFRYAVQGFFQNNPLMAEKMVSYVQELVGGNAGEEARKDGEGGEEGKRGKEREGMEGLVAQGGRATRGGRAAHLLDLFGGVGLFGVSLGVLADDVTVVESWKESVAYAEENLKANAVKGRAICLDAKQMGRLDVKPDVVITDPPRSGMPEKAIAWLLGAQPRRIIYVSCNLEQLARELLRMAPHYTIRTAAAFDLFPQTNHVETVVELERG